MKTIINRRVFFKVAATGVTGCLVSPMELFSQQQAPTLPPLATQNTARNVIFVMLPGGPSHVDTFDLKVGAWTPANFTASTVNGIDWPSGLLPQLAQQVSLNRAAVVRSCQAPALVHDLLQTWAQIGRSPASLTGRIAPNVGSVVALEKEVERLANQPVPGFLSLNGGTNIAGPGYFPGRFSPFDVAPSANGITNINPTNVDLARFNRRYSLLAAADAAHTSTSPISRKFEEMSDFYSSANSMMNDTRVANAFRFTANTDGFRYGTGTAQTGFGNACLTAKNVLLANLGVRYIQINLGGWDNHANIYAGGANGNGGIYGPARQMDAGLANLISDLAALPGTRGTMLDDTLIVVRGEFGRTVGPLTGQAGRDHHFTFSTLIAGGGVRGGRAIGSTTADGSFVDDPGWSVGRPIYSEDITATIYSALGINYRTTRWDDPLQRGFQYVSTTGTSWVGEPIDELFM
jgi:hypothetical protein